MTLTPDHDDTLEMGELTQSLGFLVRLAQVRMYDMFYAAFANTEVRPGETTVLWLIDLNPGVRQGLVARDLNIKPAHMTKLVQRLVRDGLIERCVPPEDRRSVRLTLTDQGKRHLQALRDTFLEVHAAENIGLTDVEATQLNALLYKLAFPKDRP